METPTSTLEGLIRAWVQESLENRLHSIDGRLIFEEPLVGFASGDDPLFERYKEVVGEFHLAPREALEKAGAISPRGHDKRLCRQYVQERMDVWRKMNGVTGNPGCGSARRPFPVSPGYPGNGRNSLLAPRMPEAT